MTLLFQSQENIVVYNRIYLLQSASPDCKPTTHSPNDLEINPYGRLKRKIYKKMLMVNVFLMKS